MKHIITLAVAFLLVVPVSAQAQRRDQEEKGERSKTFNVNKNGLLEVNVRSGDITITPTNKNEVSINTVGIDSEDLEYLRMTQSGDRIRVEYRPRGRDWDDWGDNHVQFDISIPTDYNVDIKTSGGDLVVTGAVNGKVEGSTSGGDIRLADVIGTIDMSTSGGDITVGNIKGNVRLRTSGGDINLRKVDGETTVSTSGGDIRAESVGKKLDANTSGGDIDVGEVGGEARLATSGGDVTVGKVSGDARLATSGGNVELRGASGTVSARTSGGDIVLENITGSIEAKTSGGDIRAELIPTGKGMSELVSSGGDIRLQIPENAKATIEAIIKIHDRRRQRDRYEVRSDFKEDESQSETYEDEIRKVYVLNGGGERITLETSNSNIEIRKLRR